MYASWLHLPLFLFLVFLLWRFKGGRGFGKVFWSMLGLKLLAGLALGYVYQEFLGGGDTWAYHKTTLRVLGQTTQSAQDYLQFLFFDQAGAGTLTFRTDSNSFFLVKILSALYLLTNDSYWMSSLYLSLFSFWGCWYFFQSLEKRFPEFSMPALVAFLLFPSIVFWSSGVSKDSLVMGAMGLLLGASVQLLFASRLRPMLKYLFLFAAAGWLFYKAKFYLAVPAIVFIGAYLAVEKASKQVPAFNTAGKKMGLWFCLMAVGGLAAYFMQSVFTPDDLGFHVMLNYNHLLAKTSANVPHLYFPDLNASFGSILWHAPQAVGQMLVRPFIWEPAPFFYKLIAVENLILLVLLLLAAMEIIRNKKLLTMPAFWWVLLCFFMVGAALVALPTPNLGSLNRYRAPLLAIFLTVVIYWVPWQRWWPAGFKRDKSA
ncbi:hypothetical protein GU926_16130 [Nibribacter ruber]|uniref:Glycosyltransferase RgtA/B/C/D-like domain-containing protein n=1 Tax=Nibribacter ruber TaxID=2698458 RepID=A0A6P1P3B3_9BACT|nr:hypothetical protein [Nibribacter ruber]QHL88873.1 hypothetical protein GU926_16130 [Nibribacter ruber]